jgi:hypothetical protein
LGHHWEKTHYCMNLLIRENLHLVEIPGKKIATIYTLKPTLIINNFHLLILNF